MDSNILIIALGGVEVILLTTLVLTLKVKIQLKETQKHLENLHRKTQAINNA